MVKVYKGIGQRVLRPYRGKYKGRLMLYKYTEGLKVGLSVSLTLC